MTEPATLRPGDEVALRIDRLAYGGQGVGRIGRLAVFVDRTAPGERVVARVRRMRRRHAEADLLRVEEPSPSRIDPICQHFREGCGGCSWQHLDYTAQLEAKAAFVRDSLERLGGLGDPQLRPIMGAADPWHYRGKMEFAFSPGVGLGLHLRGSWERVFRLDTCFLPSPLVVEIVKAARTFVLASGLYCWEPRERRGFLRELVVRRSRATGEILVGVVTSPGSFEAGPAFADAIAALDPAIVGVVHARKAALDDAAPIEDVRVLRGRATITETLRGLRFTLGVDTFFQPHSAQAERLIDLVREFAAPGADAQVVDLYAGVGVFALALAGAAERVIGVELSASAVAAARANLVLNGVGNVAFYVGDARHALPAVLADMRSTPQVVVIDPPRSGAGGKVMRRIARAGPRRIVYVSCNPTTLARDLRELWPFGYRVFAVQPVDLFPQTFHVETVVGLERAAAEGVEGLAAREATR